MTKKDLKITQELRWFKYLITDWGDETRNEYQTVLQQKWILTEYPNGLHQNPRVEIEEWRDLPLVVEK